jgi:hypothetical protein
VASLQPHPILSSLFSSSEDTSRAITSQNVDPLVDEVVNPSELFQEESRLGDVKAVVQRTVVGRL